MVVLNSIRQLVRTPVKTIFFFVLLTLAIAFFMLGYNLWAIAAKNINQINRTFSTIGTVQQKATKLTTHSVWDERTESYLIFSGPKYGAVIPISALDFKGANYIQKPEKRPVYYAYHPDFIVTNKPDMEPSFDAQILVAEIEPLKDSVPGERTRVKIKKYLFGHVNYLDEIWLSALSKEDNVQLQAGKTYLVSLSEAPSGADAQTEYSMGWSPVYSTQFTKDGKLRKDNLPAPTMGDEVTQNFYETPKGKQWLAAIDSLKRVKHTIPVVPTNSTKLLMAFFKGDARISEGRDISAEEYQNGGKVCLVQQRFAQNNGLKVGDSVRLPLYYADYGNSSSEDFYPGFDGFGLGSFNFGLLNAKDEGYSAFEDSVYKIVGIYDAEDTTTVSGYEMGANAVVIPFASVKNSDENNIVWMDHMSGTTTSFQIPNGQIDQYMAAFEAAGITDLDIKFYDKGYTKIKSGLDSMMNTAIILFAVGAVTTLFVVSLFCHLFITKQRKRTAIERSLGMSKKRCTVSLLVGMLLIIIAAYVCGSAASYELTDYTVKQVNVTRSQEAFDTTYSDWVSSADEDKITNVSISTDGAMERALAGALVIPAALFIALASIRGNLKSEPLKMLSEREK